MTAGEKEIAAAGCGSGDPILEFDIVVERREFRLKASGRFGRGITAIFGPSGAGKSTLLGALAGSVTPNEGQITLLGRKLYSSSSRVFVKPEKRSIGHVYQDSALFPHLDVLGNIEYGYRLTPRERQRLQPTDLANLLGISHLLSRKPDSLSGGETQRVALARALATSPDLLLLDEPMSALDLGLRGVVLGYLKFVHHELGTPMVYVSHSLSEVVALADCAMVLENGSVTSFESARNLLGRVRGASGGNLGTIGIENILEGRVVESHTDGTAGKVQVGQVALVSPTSHREFGERVVLSFGARDVIIATTEPGLISARNVVRGTISGLAEAGTARVVTVDCGVPIMAEVTASAAIELGLAPGREVFIVLKTSSIAVMDAFQPGG